LGSGVRHMSADGQSIASFDWDIKLRRIVNSKSLYIKVYPCEPKTASYAFFGECRYRMVVDEYQNFLFLLDTHLRKEKHDLVLTEDEHLLKRVEEKLNEVYVGNWFKRMLLLRASS